MGSKVSVILCGYNQAPHVEGAIASVLSQTHRDLELIVVDNGSTDGSRELIRRHAADSRVRLLLHETNGPVTRRLNEAVALSSGDFISIIYADDYYLPNKLERQLQAFAQLSSEYGVVYSPGYRVDDESGKRWMDLTLRSSGRVLKDMFLRAHSEGFINPITPLMRRELFIRYPYHEDVFAEGETIFLRFAVGYKFHFLDEPLAVMREHATNFGKAIKFNFPIALLLQEKLLKEDGFPQDLIPDWKVFRANYLSICGWLAIRMAADPAWARECLVAAIRLQPSYVRRPRILLGLALSILPAAAIRAFNRAMKATRSHDETIAFRAEHS